MDLGAAETQCVKGGLDCGPWRGQHMQHPLVAMSPGGGTRTITAARSKL